MSLATRLLDLRLKNKQSLQYVADKVEVSKTHIWELEKNRSVNPSLEMLTKLADHFGVTIRFLVGEDVESSDDEQLVQMFRQAGELEPSDKEILQDMINSLRKRRSSNHAQN